MDLTEKIREAYRRHISRVDKITTVWVCFQPAGIMMAWHVWFDVRNDWKAVMFEPQSADWPQPEVLDFIDSWTPWVPTWGQC